jgi:acyl-CoA thioesterase-1
MRVLLIEADRASAQSAMVPPRRLLACLIVLSTLLFAAAAHSHPILIVALGDSNTAGFNVGRENAFPARLEAMLRGNGYDVQIANAGISGDTLRGMLARLDHYVPQGTRLVIVQGGYNDVMAGSSAAALLGSIDGILSRLAARRINTVLCGFYNRGWDAVGRALTRRYGAQFVDGSVCYDTRYRGWDGLHMTAAGHQVVAARMLRVVEELLGPSRHNASVPTVWGALAASGYAAAPQTREMSSRRLQRFIRMSPSARGPRPILFARFGSRSRASAH